MKALGPGIVFAMIAWMIVSAGFSFYVKNFTNCSVIYGTLGSVIVLLMWLHMTTVLLIMGAELDAVLIHFRSSEQGTTAENDSDSIM